MSVSVRRLCRDVQKKYHANLVAGAEGLDNGVNWVHIIEDSDVVNFLRGKELVLVTGIGNIRDDNKLFEFVNSLHDQDISGLMVNLGPYIKEIPKKVINYCNEVALPMYTIPWESHLVDITRELCEIIIYSDERKESLVSLVKDYIFKAENREGLYESLTRKGFAQHLNYCVLMVGVDLDQAGELNKQESEWMREIIDRQIGKFTERYVIFKSDNKYCIVAAGMTTKRIREYVKDIEGRLRHYNSDVYIAVSSNKENLKELPGNYELVLRTYRLAKSISVKTMYYDELEIYKILLAVSGKKIIKDYEEKILEPLIEYDQGNGSDYLEFIKTFLDCNGSIQQAANVMFVHRNTIHYKINKIKEITGLDLTNLDDLLKIKLSLMIDNIK